jgi:hypothetical protein
MTTPAIRSVRYAGPTPHLGTDSWALIGQDGGQTIRVGTETLFVFSDTLLAGAAAPHHHPLPQPFAHLQRPGGMFFANTAGLAAGQDLRASWAGIRYFSDDEGVPREILPALDRERVQGLRFWPEHGIHLDGHVYLYYLGIQCIDPTTIWGFRTAGVGLAVLDPATGACRRLWRGDDWRLWRVHDDDLHFGVQALERDGFVYVFGSRRRAYASSAIVARVRPEALADPDAYEFLRSPAPEWATGDGPPLDLGPCGSEYSVSFNPYLGSYLMCYADEYAKTLVLRTAPDPWGPWCEPVVVTGLPHEPESEMVYLAFEHADFSPDGGRTVLVSYCQPRFTSNSIVAVRFR